MVSNKQAARRRRETKKRAVDTAKNDPNPWAADPDRWYDLSAPSTSNPALSGSVTSVMQHAPTASTNFLGKCQVFYVMCVRAY